jgi:hypothetical protein
MGLGELCFILLFIIIIFRPIIKNWVNLFHFSRFWIIYLLVSIFGFVYNTFLGGHATGTIKSMLFDFGAFTLVLMTCFSLENLIRKGQISTYALIRNIFLASSIPMTVLYIISIYTPSIFGLPLKHHHNFSPLANNLHQISMFLVPLPFIGLKVISVEKKWWFRLLVGILLLFDAYMAINTGSAKAYLSIYFGIFCFLMLYVYNKFQYKLRIFLVALILSISTCLVSYYSENIAIYLKEYLVFNDIHNGRQLLYFEALKVGFTSPFIGLGTGQHILYNGKLWDAHQSFLTAFLQAGFIGIILLARLFYKMLIRNMKEPAIFAAVIAILFYALGGDILRRLPIWVLMVLLFYYDEKNKFFFVNIKNKVQIIRARF